MCTTTKPPQGWHWLKTGKSKVGQLATAFPKFTQFLQARRSARAVYPSEAIKMLTEEILPHFQLITVTPQMYIETIRECADRGWIGGRIYDAIHLRCAREAECERIYTFNVRHFQQLAPDLAQRIGAP